MDGFSTFSFFVHLLLAMFFLTGAALKILRAGMPKSRDQSKEIEGLHRYLAEVSDRRGDQNREVAAE